MRTTNAALSGCLVAAAAVASTSVSASAACMAEWQQVDKDANKSGNSLSGIAVRGSDRVWVVGEDPRRGRSRPLIKRFDDGRWIREDAPRPRGGRALRDADAARRGPVWAVGGISSGTTLQAYALKRAGGRWYQTTPAQPSASLTSLNAVEVVSRKNVWAVGTFWDSAGNHRGLIEHNNGKRWRVRGPSPIGLLYDVHANAWNDVWAVGVTVRHGVTRTLTLHFNGKRWRQLFSPNLSRKPHFLYGVGGDGEGAVWAVGYRLSRRGNKPIVMRRGSERWKLVDTPDIGRRGEAELADVSVHNGEVVVIGEVDARIGWGPYILTNTGDGWKSEDPGSFGDGPEIEDVEHAPTDASAWIAGSATTGGGSEVVLRRDPCR